MGVLINSKYLDTPINIDEILSYNKDGFDKSRIYLTVTAKDELGASKEIQEEIKLYFIQNLVKNGNDFSWNFRNFSKVNIRMQIEIIDEKRNVINRGKVFEKGFNYDFINIQDTLPFKEYKDNHYYYRIRVFSLDEGWDEYFPSRRGILFNLEKDYKELKQKTINGDIRYINDWLMDKLTDETIIEPEYVKKLINLITNPVNNKVFKINNKTSGKYNTTSNFDSYGEENNFGIHDEKLHFTIDDVNNYIADKHHLNAYIDGKKVFHRDTKTQQKLDGISHSYLKKSDVKDGSIVELETFKSHLIDSESFMCKYLLQTQDDVEKLYTTGIEIKSNNIGSYHNENDFSVFVRFKNSNSWKRVNPIRTKLKINFKNDKKFSFTIIIKDNYVPKIGNEIMIVSNNVIDTMFYKTDAFNVLANYYQVPCYFVPVSHITENGEVITEFMDEVKNIEVYVNGYRLIPNVDFSLINVLLHTQIPTIILFKDMVHFGSKIEIVYHDHMDNTYFFFNQLPDRTDGRAVVTLPENSPPFIEGTFTIFANNKKLNYTQYDIINSRSLILKNVKTRKNIMIKFHYEENDLLKRLLELYKNYPPYEDIRAKNIGQDKFIDEYISKNPTQVINEEDKDYYVGLKYVYQLNDKYKYLEQIYEMIKNNISPNLDASNNNLFTNLKENPVIMDYMEKLPLYFNHHINVNCNRSYNVNRFEDNVALFNPGRSYLIHTTVDRFFDKELDCDFDCNKEDTVEFLTYLNENIPLILPYLNNNILIDCNDSYSKDNYKGLK
jgi:hypothetical protein